MISSFINDEKVNAPVFNWVYFPAFWVEVSFFPEEGSFSSFTGV